MRKNRLTLPIPILIMGFCLAAQAIQPAHAVTIVGPGIGHVFIPRSGPPVEVPMAPPQQLRGPVIGRFSPATPMGVPFAPMPPPRSPFIGPLQQTPLAPPPGDQGHSAPFIGPLHLPHL
jgi:hypothetical protein